MGVAAVAQTPCTIDNQTDCDVEVKLKIAQSPPCGNTYNTYAFNCPANTVTTPPAVAFSGMCNPCLPMATCIFVAAQIKIATVTYTIGDTNCGYSGSVQFDCGPDVVTATWTASGSVLITIQ